MTASNSISVSGGSAALLLNETSGITLSGDVTSNGKVTIAGDFTASQGGQFSAGVSVAAGGVTVGGDSAFTDVLTAQGAFTASNGASLASENGNNTLNISDDLGIVFGGDVNVAGGITATDLTASSGLTVSSEGLTVSGGGANIAGGLTVDQLAGALDANNQEITNVDIDSGAIDGVVIGANSALAGTFTDLTVSGKLTASNGIAVTGDATFDDVTFSGDLALGNDANDVITVNGEMTASAGINIPDDKKLFFGTGFDASIEYDEDGTDELRFAGAAVTFEQAVTFDGNVTLGNAATDVTTVTGLLSASQDITLASNMDVNFQGGGGPVIFDSENNLFYRIEVQGGLLVLNEVGEDF